MLPTPRPRPTTNLGQDPAGTSWWSSNRDQIIIGVITAVASAVGVYFVMKLLEKKEQ